jgi:anti-sigma B factor antagonist
MFWSEDFGPSTRVLGVRGDLDLAAVPAFRLRFREELDRAETLLVDLSELDYFDSVGLSALIEAWRLASRANQRVVMVVPQALWPRFEVRGVDGLLPIARDREAALAQIADAV